MIPAPQKFTQRQSLDGKQAEIFFYVDPLPVSVPPHQHDFYELYLFIDGRNGQVQYQAGDELYDLAPGDILLIPPDVPHHPLFPKSPSPYRRIVLWFTENALHSLQHDGDLPLSRAKVALYRFSPVISSYILETAFSMAEEFYSDDSCSALLAHAYFEKLFAIIARYAEQQKHLRPGLKEDQLAIDAIFYINHHLLETLSLDVLADKCFVSKYYLSRKFKEYTSMTVHQYIQQRRMLWAKSLLESGHLPSDVYKRCGFNSYSTFFRAFSAYYGLSPRGFLNVSLNRIQAPLNKAEDPEAAGP